MPASFHFCVVWVCLSAFGYGYNISSLNNLEVSMTCRDRISGGWFLTDCVDLNANQFGFVSAAFAVGGLLGSLIAGGLADRQGRKAAIVQSSTYLAAGSTLLALSGTLFLLIVSRLIIGIGCGMATVLVPIYLSEISPPETRGRIGILNQWGITTGIFIALGLGIPFGQPMMWRTVPFIGAALPLAQILFASAVIESPVWLASRENMSSPSAEQSGLLQEAQTDATEDGLPSHLQNSLSIPELLKSTDSAVNAGLRVVLVTQIAQQISGINAVLYFSTSILGGVFPTSAQLISLAIAAMNWITTLAPSLLIDKLGRRSLMLLSSAACGTSTLLLGLGLATSSRLLSSVAILSFVGAFSIGLGAIPFLLIPEVVPSHATGAAGSFGLALNWVTNFIVGASFKPLNHLCNSLFGTGSVFFLFAAASAVTTLLISRVYNPPK